MRPIWLIMIASAIMLTCISVAVNITNLVTSYLHIPKPISAPITMVCDQAHPLHVEQTQINHQTHIALSCGDPTP